MRRYTGFSHIWYDQTGNIKGIRGIMDDDPPAVRVTPEGTPNWQVITTQVSEDDYAAIFQGMGRPERETTHYVDPHSKKLVRK